MNGINKVKIKKVGIKMPGRAWGWWMVQAGASDPPLVYTNLDRGRAMTWEP